MVLRVVCFISAYFPQVGKPLACFTRVVDEGKFVISYVCIMYVAVKMFVLACDLNFLASSNISDRTGDRVHRHDCNEIEREDLFLCFL